METTSPAEPLSVPGQSHAIIRHLRHEVGDLLQTIYASAAILQERLPAEYVLERRIVSDLRGRAESCKHMLDNMHDFVSPLTLHVETLDLAELARSLVAVASTRHSRLEILAEAADVPRVVADAGRMTQIGRILLDNACDAAKHRVLFRTALGARAGEVEWSVADDGLGVPAEQMDQLFDPLSRAHSSRSGLGLALVRKLILLHGGQILATNLAEGGFQVTVSLPVEGPARGKTG